MRRLTISLCTAAAAACLAAGPTLAADPYDPKSPGEAGSPAHERDPADDPRATGPQAADPQARPGTPQADQGFQRDSDTATTGSAMEMEYVVEEGDTLAEIAKDKLGSADKWQEIARANGIDDPAQLQVGQKLKIPSGDRS